MTMPPVSPHTADFVSRHIGPRDSDLQTMVGALGFDSLEELIAQAVPSDIRTDRELEIASWARGTPC
jgi:glycine dehydrogenase